MTNYIVMEIQNNADGTTGIPPLATFENADEAWARYYSICSVAVVSQVFEHCVVIMDRQGQTLERKAFPHGQSNFPEAEGGEE